MHGRVRTRTCSSRRSMVYPINSHRDSRVHLTCELLPRTLIRLNEGAQVTRSTHLVLLTSLRPWGKQADLPDPALVHITVVLRTSANRRATAIPVFVGGWTCTRPGAHRAALQSAALD